MRKIGDAALRADRGHQIPKRWIARIKVDQIERPEEGCNKRRASIGRMAQVGSQVARLARAPRKNKMRASKMK